jgi:protein required for attachment to host cells
MIVEHNAWVVVADGGGAAIYRNTGREGLAQLELVETHDAHHRSFTHQDGTDRPGRVASSGGVKSALAGPDYHEQGEQEFAHGLAGHLDALIGAHRHGEAEPNLILFAAPRFLGMIRPAYSARIRSVIKAEIAKDFRDASIADIEQALKHV